MKDGPIVIQKTPKHIHKIDDPSRYSYGDLGFCKDCERWCYVNIVNSPWAMNVWTTVRWYHWIMQMKIRKWRENEG